MSAPSCFFFKNATDTSQCAELGVAMLQQCSGMNRIKLCRKRFSSTTEVTFLCLTYPLQLWCSFSSKLSCWTRSVTWSPQFFTPKMVCTTSSHKNAVFRKWTTPIPMHQNVHYWQQAYVFRPGCSFKLTVNHGDLVLNPDMDTVKIVRSCSVARV